MKQPPDATIHTSADVAASATFGAGTTVWHLAQVREHALIGQSCIIGRGAYIGVGVTVGDRVKVQNYALLYEPSTVEDDVFIGPAAVLTNDRYPRSVSVDGELKRAVDWTSKGCVVCQGASIGAHAVILSGVTIGRWAVVAAGAVVTRDVADFSLVAGVPARQIGWVGVAGRPLTRSREGLFACPETGGLYQLTDGKLDRIGATPSTNSSDEPT